MSKKQSPSIFSTLQKTAEHASAANGELVRSLPVEALEGSALGFRYYEDKDMAAVIPYRVIAENQPQKRNN